MLLRMISSIQGSRPLTEDVLVGAVRGCPLLMAPRRGRCGSTSMKVWSLVTGVMVKRSNALLPRSLKKRKKGLRSLF